jgi:hypothetical protein
MFLDGLRRLFRKLDEATNPPPAPQPEIRLSDQGFVILHDGGEVARVEWAKVKEIIAYKRDCGTTDLICLGFRTSNQCEYCDCETHEHMTGAPALWEAVKRQFPGSKTDWYFTVMSPPFATSLTHVWGEPRLWKMWQVPDED